MSDASNEPCFPGGRENPPGCDLAETDVLSKVPLAEVQQAIGQNLQKIERIHVPQKTKKTEYLEGSPGEIAKKLVDKLRNEVRVL